MIIIKSYFRVWLKYWFVFSYGIIKFVFYCRVSIFYGSVMIECKIFYDIIYNYFINRKVYIVIFKVIKRLKYK